MDDFCFDNAYQFMMKHEGGFVNDPADHGKATKWGISLRFLQLNKLDLNRDGLINSDDIHYLTPSQTKSLYYNYFWRIPKIYNLTYDAIAIKTFDCAVNMGPKKAIQLLQRAINVNLTRKRWLLTDGIIGIKTCTILSDLCIPSLLNTYCDILIKFYEKIIILNPSQIKYKNGWLKRAKDVEGLL